MHQKNCVAIDNFFHIKNGAVIKINAIFVIRKSSKLKTGSLYHDFPKKDKPASIAYNFLAT